ncbi:ATP-binding protein [Azospirillum picis]|uniref:histidine kinase n=1 Tax=Azospirillum picis TaxID=488438 RepID=A0ABU0MMB5_9PROT|nr:ATP-binding protein [Azospirillum picis]MBP2300638.1 signal transduction histidine kinase [Azospirillum picis]MDQ0534607.1 signal transduction histidine kinase [Azospirillum picis]
MMAGSAMGTKRRMIPATTNTRWMTARYALALILIALGTLAGFVMTERVIGQHERMLEVVNVSGRQRMLSQRTALLVEQIKHAADPEARVDLSRQLAEATDAFEHAHHLLRGRSGTDGPPLGPPPQGLFFSGPDPLDPVVNAHVAALRRVIAAAAAGRSPDPADADRVAAQALGPLLDRLEQMVALYQEEGEAGFHMLHRLGLAALMATLLMLGIEALVIFRPMTRQVRRQFTEILRMAETIEQANATLEQQVRDRTAELHAAKTAAEQAHLAKSRFLAHASHDLQQPLQAIGMFTGMLERQPQNGKAAALLTDLKAAQRSMRDLLNAILDISKLESGVVTPKPADVPLSPLLDQLEAEFAGLAEAKGLRLRTVPTGVVVRSDPAMLERIIRNLIANAIRYTDTGGVLVGCRTRGDSVSIEVYDTGRGIPEADRRRIFEEFVQLDRADRDRSEGIGLGLAIVERLARLLGHPVTVRSTEGRGTVFAVRVPLAR